jgi:hypothetical protein
MAKPAEPEAYSVEIKSSEILLHVPEPLMETLGRMAQYRRCSIEQLVINLIADNSTVQKFFTKAALGMWEPS